MNDVTGMPQSAVVIGGGSDIALALLRRLASRRLSRVVLAGRDLAGLQVAADELRSLGIDTVEVVELDVCAVEGHEAFVADVARRINGLDLLVVAAGMLGTADLEALGPEEVARSISTNFTGPAALLTGFARSMRDQGYGRIVVLSSVAGVRVRAANFVYGAGKAGLDGFSQALGDLLEPTGVSVMIVRPGFVHSKMTTGRQAAPLAVGPDEVAAAIERGLERGSAVVWVPAVLRAVFGAFRLLPQPLWRRIPG